MKKYLGLALGMACTASIALASNLNVSVQTDCGSNACPNEVTVGLGATVNYQVVGVLNDSINEGLALVGFDLAFTGGPLTQANNPTSAPMNNFANNLGINNPAGYGGTVQGGVLKQVGGGQNTIKNTADNAPFPIGTVITGLAQPPNALILVTGSLTAPMAEGTYNLNLTNLFGNVIKDGETGEIFYKTEAFGNGSITNLTIIVEQNVPQGTWGLASSSPACGSSLWRSQNNTILLDFECHNGPCDPLQAPEAGDLQISTISDGGAFGTDLNTGANFTVTLENGGTRLRILENGTQFTHRTWVTIRHANESWANAENFKVDLVVQIGDVTGDGRVLAADVSAINTCIPCASVSAGCTAAGCVEPFVRRDINGDNRILAADVSIANARIPSANVTKPTGHTCAP